jgi:hypothetical protein
MLIAHIARSRCVRDHMSGPSPPVAADWRRPSRAGTAVRRYCQRKVLLYNVTRRHRPHRRNPGKIFPTVKLLPPWPYSAEPNDSPANGVVHYACAPTVPALKIFLVDNHASPTDRMECPMPSTSDSSDSARHASTSVEPRHYCHGKVPGAGAFTVGDVSPPPVTRGGHPPSLGTAAATDIAPSWDSERDVRDARQDGAAPSGNGWIASLARLVKPSGDGRRECRPHPGRLHSEYLAGARMAREMRRL